jgi:hypothetical protein
MTRNQSGCLIVGLPCCEIVTLGVYVSRHDHSQIVYEAGRLFLERQVGGE